MRTRYSIMSPMMNIATPKIKRPELCLQNKEIKLLGLKALNSEYTVPEIPNSALPKAVRSERYGFFPRQKLYTVRSKTKAPTVESKKDSIRVRNRHEGSTGNKVDGYLSSYSQGKRPKKSFFNVISDLYFSKKFINRLKGINSMMTPKFLAKRHFSIINDLSFFYEQWKNAIGRQTKQGSERFLERQSTQLIGKLMVQAFKFSKSLPVFDDSMALVILWNVLNCVLDLGYFLLIPLEICFEVKLSSDNAAMSWINFFAFFIFGLDMLVSCNMKIYLKGCFISDRGRILKEYLRGDFLPDLIGLGSVFIHTHNAVIVKIDDFSDVSVYLQLIRLTFFLKFIKFSKVVKRLEEMLFIDDSVYHMVSLLKLIARIIFISHVFACVWYVIGHYDGENSWLESNGLSDRPWYIQYVNSYYFVCITMNTVGYGDITPKNAIEKVFSIIFTYFACGIFAYSLNSIGVIVSELAKHDKEFLSNLNLMNRFMKKNNINFELKLRVRKYLEYIFFEERIEEVDEEDRLMGKLSDSLKEEILLEANGSILRKLKMFSLNFSEGFLRSLVPLLQKVRFTPEDIIYMKGEMENGDLFIILNGKVELCYESNKGNQAHTSLKTLEQGETFGEISFFSNQERETCARSMDFTTVYRINKDQFLQVITKFDEDYQKYCQIKDSLNNYRDYSQLYVKCLSCNESNHLINQCPLLTCRIIKDLVIKRHIYPTIQERAFKQRRARTERICTDFTNEIENKALELQNSLLNFEMNEDSPHEESAQFNEPTEANNTYEGGSITDTKIRSVGLRRRDDENRKMRRSWIKEESPMLVAMYQRGEGKKETSSGKETDFLDLPSFSKDLEHNMRNLSRSDENEITAVNDKKHGTLMTLVGSGSFREGKKSSKIVRPIRYLGTQPHDSFEVMKIWEAYFPENNAEKIIEDMCKSKSERRANFSLLFPKKKNGRDLSPKFPNHRKSVMKKRFFQDPSVISNLLKETEFDVHKYRKKYLLQKQKRKSKVTLRKWLSDFWKWFIGLFSRSKKG